MPVTAKLRYLRIAPRKVREVVDLIRGKKVEDAQTLLEFAIRKPARPILKLLKSAIASAKHNFQLDQSNLYIAKILVDEGPKLKRWRAASRGRASPILKRTSHITLVLEEIEMKKRKKIKAKEVEKLEKPKIEEKPEKEKREIEKPKFKLEKEVKKPERKIGLKRIFKRKAF